LGESYKCEKQKISEVIAAAFLRHCTNRGNSSTIQELPWLLVFEGLKTRIHVLVLGQRLVSHSVVVSIREVLGVLVILVGFVDWSSNFSSLDRLIVIPTEDEGLQFVDLLSDGSCHDGQSRCSGRRDGTMVRWAYVRRRYHEAKQYTMN